MRSKTVGPARTQLRIRDRFGAVLVASTTVLCVELPLWAIALFTWGQLRENPGTYNFGLMFFVVIPLSLVLLVLVVLTSIGAVMPIVASAERLGRRFGGSGAWWWTPAPAALWTTPLPLVVMATTSPTAVAAALGVWLAGTVSLTAPALVARRLLLTGRPRLTGGVMFGRVVGCGVLTVIAAGVLGIGLTALFAYEPPRLSTARAVGTWSNADGSTLVLTADGRAEATGSLTPDDDYEDLTTTSHDECAGTGTWTYDPGTGPWSQRVSVSIDGCPETVAWNVLGTPSHPKLFFFVGDPDSWDLYALERRSAGSA